MLTPLLLHTTTTAGTDRGTLLRRASRPLPPTPVAECCVAIDRTSINEDSTDHGDGGEKNRSFFEDREEHRYAAIRLNSIKRSAWG